MWQKGLIISLVLHVGLAVVCRGFTQRFEAKKDQAPRKTVRLQIETEVKAHSAGVSKTLKGGGGSHSTVLARFALRPWVLGGGRGEFGQSNTFGDGSTQFAKRLLTSNSRELAAFDQLALLLHSSLDYPEMLIERGIQGTAEVDLYFNEVGTLDENRSRYSGSHRYVRGLIVGATRASFVKWMAGVGARLKPSELKNQHFHAEFVLSYVAASKNEVGKVSEGYYSFLRRHGAQSCLMPQAGAVGLNVACVAAEVGGKVRDLFSGKRKIQFYALTDRLDHWDELGFQGVNELIKS